MEHTVKGCKDCCFEYEMQGCNNPIHLATEYAKYDHGEYMDAMDSEDHYAKPSWCPLLKEPTVIKIEPTTITNK